MRTWSDCYTRLLFQKSRTSPHRARLHSRPLPHLLMRLDNSKPAANTCLRHVSRVPANSDDLGDGAVAAREQGMARLDAFACNAASPTFWPGAHRCSTC